jgi:hypothetical protein
LGLFSALKGALLVGLITVTAFSAYMTWRWVDDNLLHWGIRDVRETHSETTELLARIQAFEVVSVKHQYEVQASIDVDKALGAGPVRTDVPGWLAGQGMKAKGDMQVAAAIDLQQLRPEDITISELNGVTEVHIRVPAPFITSTEILPDSLDIDTNKGILTRVRTSVGLPERDLRDEASDALGEAARTAALDQGLLVEAATETKAKLEAFLNSLPQNGSERLVYVVDVVDSVAH